MTVDAYRDAIEFYRKNDFHLVQPKELEEKTSTVSMYFDLMRYVEARKSTAQ